MKILAIHSDYIKVEAKKQAIKAAEKIDEKEVSMEDCLVVFCSAEKEDEQDAKQVANELVRQVKDIAKQVEADKIMLYPYVHLSSKPSNPKIAQEILKEAEKKLGDFEVKHAPFGWYKSFEIKCKGHPLSELSREFGPVNEAGKIAKEVSKSREGEKDDPEANETYVKLLDFLDENNAEYRLMDHPKEGRTDIVSPMRGNKVEQAAKCIVIMIKKGKKEKKYVLGIVPGDAKVDLDKIKEMFEGTYASFAPKDVAEELSGCVSGTVLPFSFNSEMEVVIDPLLLDHEELFFNAARLDRSMALKTKDYERLVEGKFESIAKYDKVGANLKREAKDEPFEYKKKELSQQEKESMSAAGILAKVVKKVYPDAQIANIGLYHDQAYLDVKGIIVRKNELTHLEKESRKFLREKPEFSESKVEDLNELQKDIAKDLGKNAKVYSVGDVAIISCHNEPFVNGIVTMKLVNSGSAYWKNNETNDQLTRIYCIGFSDRKDMEVYLKKREEAENRSHIKIGREQGLFVISDLVGPGLPLLAPKGAIIRNEVIDFLWDLHKKRGYSKVVIPHMAKPDLYKKSGHWEKFGDELFTISGKYGEFVMKPMNCPHHTQIFDAFQHSYRDLPVRFFEPTMVYRDEKSGQLHGLGRVRSITQDDGHIFCRESQIKEEVHTIVEIALKFYETLGMTEDYWVSLSVRGDDKSKYLGSDKVWDLAEKSLEEAAKELKLNYKKVEGEAAFYGPKLDFMFKDALGREWQLATIQCDFNLPERFDLSFINEKNEKERPVMIHRAISGSLERFMSVIIEHFAGKFPLWMNPVQVKILTVTERAQKFADEVYAKLRDKDIRVEMHEKAATVSKKIRDGQVEKVNYLLVVGDNEVESGKLAVRNRKGEVTKDVEVNKFVEQLLEEIKTKKL